MKCREVRCWLYSFRPNACWPADVVTHLQGCPACGQLRLRLQRIDEEVAKLTGPASDGTPQARLLDRIAGTAQEAGARGQEPGVRSQEAVASGSVATQKKWSWYGYAGVLAGMAAMIGLAFLLGHWWAGQTPGPTVEIVKTVEVVREVRVPTKVETPSPQKKDAPETGPASAHLQTRLLAALLERGKQMAGSAKAADRLGALLGAAEDCRKQAVLAAEDGPRDALPFIVALYTQVLQEGLTAQLAQAPVKERRALQNLARNRLQRMPRVVDPPGAAKAVRDQLAALQTATQQALDGIDRPEEAPPRKTTRPEATMPSAALVQFIVAGAAEPDPINRAEACAECAQRVLPGLILNITEGAEPERIAMGQAFGTMMRRGIYAPLAALDKEPPPAVKEQTSRIYQSAGQTAAELEEHLKQADPRTRPALQAALDAMKADAGKS